MPHSKDDLIRERAYQIWEMAGRPHGRDKEHWEQARSEIEEELSTAVGVAGEARILADRAGPLEAERSEPDLQRSGIDEMARRRSAKSRTG